MISLSNLPFRPALGSGACTLDPRVSPFGSSGRRGQANFPAQAAPLLEVISQARPQHLAAGFPQAAHAELPQSEFGFQPQVANAPLRKDGRDRPRKTSTFNFYVANLACKTILY